MLCFLGREIQTALNKAVLTLNTVSLDASRAQQREAADVTYNLCSSVDNSVLHLAPFLTFGRAPHPPHSSQDDGEH